MVSRLLKKKEGRREENLSRVDGITLTGEEREKTRRKHIRR